MLLSAPRRARRRAARGFTLTELMVVVALVGIFAAMGIVSFRRQVSSATTGEAFFVISAIRAAEEAYRGENQVYLNVSKHGWYPSANYGDRARSFAAPDHNDYAAWQRLGPMVKQPVKFRYQVNSGAPGTALPTNLNVTKPLGFTPTDAWYLIQARADFDSDGDYCDAVASSLNSEVFVENEGE